MDNFLKPSFSFLKSLSRIVVLLITVAFFTVLSSCGGDDEKPANKITVDGNTIKLTHGYITSINDDDVSEHIIFLTSEDVNFDEGDISGTGDVVIFYIASEEPTMVKGTYKLTASPDYGDLVFFEIGHTVNGQEPESYYVGAEGNVKVTSAKGDKYTFKFDFSEVILSTEEDDTEIDGKMEGYFSGTLESFDTSEGRLAEKIAAFRKKK